VADPPTFQGVPLTGGAPLGDSKGDDYRPPKYTFLNPEAVEWSAQTGRPIWEWLWEKER
jgi:hypothetical protein